MEYSDRFKMIKIENNGPRNSDMYLIKDLYTQTEYLYVSVGYSGSMIKLENLKS
jgi:hypothetical protein